MPRSLFASLLLALPAAACINDSELPTHEREFRAAYGRGERPPAPSPATTASLPAVAAIAGGLLLVAAAVVTLRRR